jgi:hypothetical protein
VLSLLRKKQEPIAVAKPMALIIVNRALVASLFFLNCMDINIASPNARFPHTLDDTRSSQKTDRLRKGFMAAIPMNTMQGLSAMGAGCGTWPRGSPGCFFALLNDHSCYNQRERTDHDKDRSGSNIEPGVLKTQKHRLLKLCS